MTAPEIFGVVDGVALCDARETDDVVVVVAGFDRSLARDVGVELFEVELLCFASDSPSREHAKHAHVMNNTTEQIRSTHFPRCKAPVMKLGPTRKRAHPGMPRDARQHPLSVRAHCVFSIALTKGPGEELTKRAD